MLAMSSFSYGQIPRLTEMLESGRKKVIQLIEDYSLELSLADCPYLGYWSGQSWIIVCKTTNCFQAYYGRFDNDFVSVKTVPISDWRLSSLFSLTSEDFNDYQISDEYHFWYSYFVLYDTTHMTYIECNSIMVKNSCGVSGQDTETALLPSSIVALWEIMMPDVFRLP